MNTIFKNSALIVLSLCLAACVKESPSLSYIERAYKEALRLHREGNLNDALFHYQHTALLCQYTPDDSLSYWWKGMCGQGKVWLQKNFTDDAEKDFRAVLEFARRHRLDTAEYTACRQLTGIALQRQEHHRAYGYNRRALQIAEEKGYPANLTKGLEEETALAQSAHLLAQGQALPEALHRRLAHLAADTSALWKRQILALRLLALQDTSYLPTYLRMQDEYWTTRFRTFTDEAEREKKGLIAERDAIAAGQKHTLFIALTLFALLLGGGLYAVAGHRRKHELEHVRFLLSQKEQAIQILEGQQEDTERLRRQILEKEKRMEELVQRERKLQELSSLAQGKEKDLARFSRLTREIDELRHRIEQKQLEWKEKEAQIRRHHLYDLPISHRLPVADNPHQPRKEDFDGLLANKERQMEFLQEMDRCFNRFAAGLKVLTPGLTDEEAVYCCLFRLNVRPTDIAVLMATSRSNVSKRRIRIENKLSFNCSTTKYHTVQGASKC